MLKNKVIFVAGGTGLLGRRISKAVLMNGGKLILGDINRSALDKFKLELDEEFPSQKYITSLIDINEKNSILNSIQDSILPFGRIDALVNSAYPRNKNYGRHFFDVEYSDFCENLSLHLGGYFLVSQQFAKYFSENQGGNIINIASVYGMIAPKFEIYKDTPMTMPVEYAAIKSAVIHLTAYMAKYLSDKNIRVNCVSPGGILDNQPEAFLKKYRENCLSKGMLDPDDVTGSVVFLLSDQSKFINGQNIVIDDGFTL
ncbi:oxidoreductase [Leptospira ilyithenensis]|uniref:SDR family oxidoreductase n=1 Tax=Leptospira ilyithenensis TaxID=2484901 RepID=A0A4R9LPV7_9LEPT|nr:oxidoreductase [Leptospira ilyithenensis]TGN08000.1 SDR family oxidoreductase [Leptospira ilyithenensis]